MKNEHIINEEVLVMYVKRQNGTVHEVLVDVGFFNKINEFPYTWGVVHTSKRKSYIYTKHRVRGKKIMVYLHRFLVGAKDGLQVDHINGNTFDNRITNLRIVTNAENQQNRKNSQINSKSGVRGVYWLKKPKKWQAAIYINQKKIDLGRFKNIEEAEQTVKEARAKYMPYSKEALAN